LVNGLNLSQDSFLLFKESLKKMLRGEYLNTLRCGNQLIELKNPVVMGIVNTTPDSFYAPGRTNGLIDNALAIAGRMLGEGARIIDIGGMSSRPGAEEIPAGEELARVLPVVEAIHAAYPEAIISVDTYRLEVAGQCLKAGARMINDIYGGQKDDGFLKVIADYHAAYVLMHMRGTPSIMAQMTDYKDVIADLIKYFVKQIQVALKAGIKDIVLDPGFGFAKTTEQNYELIDRLACFRLLERPLLVGISRKSTLSKTIGRPAEDTLQATTALHMVALQNGASILRVHDVLPAMDAIAVFKKLRAQGEDIN
jgi:dihydropteroate synthase